MGSNANFVIHNITAKTAHLIHTVQDYTKYTKGLFDGKILHLFTENCLKI